MADAEICFVDLCSGLALLSAQHQVVFLLHSHPSQQASHDERLAKRPLVLGTAGHPQSARVTVLSFQKDLYFRSTEKM